MRTRALRIVRRLYPVTGICERCNQTFISRYENLAIADEHVRSQFDAHKCEVKTGKKDTTMESP